MVTCALIAVLFGLLSLQNLLIVSGGNVLTDTFNACGAKPASLVKPFIVGGDTALDGAWPWQVAIKFQDPNTGIIGLVCGGTLIDPSWVLTAAHCVDGRLKPGRGDPSRFQILSGSNKIASYLVGGQNTAVQRINLHPNWIFNVATGFQNDIALMKLAEPVPIMSSAGLACLPASENVNLQGANCWITGWGMTEANDPSSMPALLQEAESPVISEATCQATAGLPVTGNQVCVGGGGSPTTCTGDSGGPLSCEKDGVWIVAGIASWSLSCSSRPSVLTRVAKYRQWIMDNINNS